MKKILFFPLLRLPSGHHQVADSVISYLENRDSECHCKKIDLLSAWSPVLESMITKTYLSWIHYFPKSYAWTYKKMAHNSNADHNYKKYYDQVFLKKLREILMEEQPDLIVCTHAFPSHLLSTLKSKQEITVPVINIYTDFFINDIWGTEGIDYHFVASTDMKRQLIEEKQVLEEKIWVTGIPIGEQFSEGNRNKFIEGKALKILVSGGSAGLGNMTDLVDTPSSDRNHQLIYYVLCGKNKRLFQQLKQLNRKDIHPIAYITDRFQMNALYEHVDAIITKPGGVTVSEALTKRLPIFVHSVLPGQEEINLQILKEHKLVMDLDSSQPLESTILPFFQQPELLEQYQQSIDRYLGEIEAGLPANMVDRLHRILHTVPDDALFEKL